MVGKESRIQFPFESVYNPFQLYDFNMILYCRMGG